ncbi:hypothetical protein E4U57_002278 [Claviceps arundinis]|nr:hypothetical protein E4U57_002278 [Claviceps arundinis]
MHIHNVGLTAMCMLSCISAAPVDAASKRGAKPAVGDDAVWSLISDKREAKPEVGDDAVWSLISDKREVKPKVGDDAVWSLISD